MQTTLKHPFAFLPTTRRHGGWRTPGGRAAVLLGAAAALALAGPPDTVRAIVPGGTYTSLVDTSQAASGHGNFNLFVGPPSISGNNVLFNASYYLTGSSGSTGRGIYTGKVGTAGASLVADYSTLAPGHGNFDEFGSFVLSGDNVAFGSSYYLTGSSGSTGRGIYTGKVGTAGASLVADYSTLAPGHGNFFNFPDYVNLDLSGDNLAFYGIYDDPDNPLDGGEGIYTAKVGTAGMSLVVDTSTPAPGHGNFHYPGIPVLRGDNVAFYGIYYQTGSSGAEGYGMYTGKVGTAGASLVADASTPVPSSWCQDLHVLRGVLRGEHPGCL